MRRLYLCFMLFIFVAVSTQGQNCTDFVVLDQYSSSSDYKSYEKIKDVLCGNEVNDVSSARNAGVKAGIPIPVVDDILKVNFEGNASSSDWSHWQKAFCHSSYYEAATQLSQSHVAQILSDNARQIIDTCLNREPVYAYYTVAPDGQSFALTFGVQGKEKLKGASVQPADAVRNCDPQNPFGLSWLDQHITNLDISGQKKAFSCSWDSNKTVHVQLHLANQGDRSIPLPGIVKRETIAPPPPLVVTAETYRSNNLPSGHCGDFSTPYDLCSADKPDGWTIVSSSFQLVGDRSCNGWSTCARTTSAPTKVCYQFSMQGHNDECGHSGNTGIHFSTGVLDVTWQHH